MEAQEKMNLIIISLALTLFLEFGVYAVFMKKDLLMLLIYSALINFFTWPMANLLFEYSHLFLLTEFLVFIVEGILIKALLEVSWKKALLISFIANVITMYLGIAIGILPI